MRAAARAGKQHHGKPSSVACSVGRVMRSHHRAHRTHEERGNPLRQSPRACPRCDPPPQRTPSRAGPSSFACRRFCPDNRNRAGRFRHVGAFSFKPALEAFRVKHARQALGRRHAEMMAALGAHFVVGKHALRVDAVALRARDPRVVATVTRRVAWRRASAPRA